MQDICGFDLLLLIHRLHLTFDNDHIRLPIILVRLISIYFVIAYFFELMMIIDLRLVLKI